jgi:hypothetical protein
MEGFSKGWSWLLAAALLGAVGSTATTGSADEENENETPTTLDKIPPPARDALRREAAGAPIVDVSQQQEHGRTTYEAHVRKGNELIGIEVDQDGKLLGRHSEKGEQGHKERPARPQP